MLASHGLFPRLKSNQKVGAFLVKQMCEFWKASPPCSTRNPNQGWYDHNCPNVHNCAINHNCRDSNHKCRNCNHNCCYFFYWHMVKGCCYLECFRSQQCFSQRLPLFCPAKLLHYILVLVADNLSAETKSGQIFCARPSASHQCLQILGEREISENEICL